MKEKMIAALNAAGVKTEGLTDDQVWDAYNQQAQKKAGGGDPGQPQINSDAITAAVNLAIKPLTDEIGTLKTQLQANAEKDLKTKRDAVKTKFPFMTEGDQLTGRRSTERHVCAVPEQHRSESIIPAGQC